MPRPKDPNKKVQLSIRMRPQMKEAVLNEAEAEEISASEYVERAVRAWQDDTSVQLAQSA